MNTPDFLLHDFRSLDSIRDRFDQAVNETRDIDVFCSLSHWVLPFQASFVEEASPWIAEREGHFVALMGLHGGTQPPILFPLEAAWGLASPLLGPRSSRQAALLTDLLHSRQGQWRKVILTGVMEGGETWKQALARCSSLGYRLFRGETQQRWVASLEGGWEGFLGRRSPAFRASLRRALRNQERTGVTVIPVHEIDADLLYSRILHVEARSWKGAQQIGFSAGAMERFYRLMLPRLKSTGKLRALMLQRDGEDVAFIFGGVHQGRYRGLQVSFDERFRPLALGNVAQARMIQHLCEEGVREYDLGSDMPYKASWGEEGLVTTQLIVVG